MYCTARQVESQLSQALTSANPRPLASGTPVKGNLQSIGRTTNFSVIPEVDVEYYIRMADSHIDAALSQQYQTPFMEKARPQMSLTEAVDEYNDTTVYVDQAGILGVGDVLVFTDGTNTERTEVEELLDFESVVISGLTNLYAVGTRVLRIKYPDPIPYLSAKLAASAIFKKYFSAQVEPGKTEYGELMRNEVIQELNNIREGRTILHDATRIGWRFANPNLVDRYTVKDALGQDGTRSDTGGR